MVEARLSPGRIGVNSPLGLFMARVNIAIMLLLEQRNR